MTVNMRNTGVDPKPPARIGNMKEMKVLAAHRQAIETPIAKPRMAIGKMSERTSQTIGPAFSFMLSESTFRYLILAAMLERLHAEHEHDARTMCESTPRRSRT